MTFEIAASSRLGFTTACYSLRETPHLRKGEGLPIHGCAILVSQAALQLAKLVGEDVLSFIESEQKKGH